MQYNQSTLDQFKVSRPGMPEVIRQRLIDYQLYPAAGQAQLTFFANPVGQGLTSALGAVAGTPKTLADTNMTAAGQLSKGVQFLAESIEIAFEPGSVATANTFTNVTPATFTAVAASAIVAQLNDVNTVRMSGWLEFYILSKTYLTEAPLGSFPPKTRLEIDAAIATNSASTGVLNVNTARWGGRPYTLDPPITLDSNTNFNVFIKWPGAVALPSGFNGRIGVILDGVQYRLSQ